MSLRPPQVWFVLPSANAENCRRRLPAWRDLGYRIAVLQDRVRFEAPCDVVIRRDRYPGWGASVNAMFREVVPADCPVIVSGGDDMLPDPSRRAGEIAEEFLDHFAGSFGVMQPTGDDFEATAQICGSPWMGREWLERMYAGRGGMSEAYVHQYADDELFWVSRCASRLWIRPDLTQRHEHFRRTNEPAPRYWAESAGANDEADCLTFIARSRAGFPGASPADEPGLLDMDVFEREYTGRAEAWYRSRYAGSGDTAHNAEPSRRMRDALALCAAEGLHRVAIFGAGQHTARAADALRDPPVEIAAIIDDDADRIGRRLWNFPIVSRERAIELNLDAVVLSSDAMEARLVGRAAPLASAGVRVVSLYGADRQVRAGA
ncbi:MAG: hypothetical protein H6810_07000 [Phycisphaeraceae bacterium]|nr:MAG: hypothetical protein H6810_07000 [Phycisphaeraceae bacterium]